MSTTTQLKTPESTSPPPLSKPNGKAEPLVAREIPLSAIQPSKTNPRKTFDTAADQELVESIKQLGVVQPILVRPYSIHRPGQQVTEYELVAGERRFRAATKAGLKSVPAVVREISDLEALEIQVVENQQRKDVTPLEEGRGYKAIVDALAKPDAADVQGLKRQQAVEQVAKRVGKSVRYVYARIKLMELIPELQQDLDKGLITASHADELVRLCAKDQAEFRERDLYFWNGDAGAPDEELGFSKSVRHIKSVIETEYQLELKKAGFPVDDANLVPAAGACGTCLKNSLNSPLVDADKKKAMCMDRACFAGKVAAFVKVDAIKLQAEAPQPSTKQAAAPVLKVTTQHNLDYERSKSKDKPLVRSEWKSAKPGECDSVQPAMVVDCSGLHDQAVKAKLVCANEKCKVHFAPKPKASPAQSGGSAAPAKMTLEELREENQEQFDTRRATLAMLQAAKLALAKVEKLTEADMRFVVQSLEDSGVGDVDGALKAVGLGPWRKAKVADLPRVLLGAAFERQLHDLTEGETPWDKGGLEQFIKGRGVDLAKVEASIEKEIRRCSICGCFEESACRLPGTAGPCTWMAEKNSFGQKNLCSNPLCKAEAERLAKAKADPRGARVAEIKAGLDAFAGKVTAKKKAGRK